MIVIWFVFDFRVKEQVLSKLSVTKFCRKTIPGTAYFQAKVQKKTEKQRFVVLKTSRPLHNYII